MTVFISYFILVQERVISPIFRRPVDCNILLCKRFKTAPFSCSRRCYHRALLSPPLTKFLAKLTPSIERNSTMTSDATYPPALDAGLETERLSQTIKDWSIANGLAVRPPPALVGQNQDPEGILAINAPVTLFPSPFPKSCFEEAKAIQTNYNELYARISQDEEFLGRLVQE